MKIRIIHDIDYKRHVQSVICSQISAAPPGETHGICDLVGVIAIEADPRVPDFLPAEFTWAGWLRLRS